jgi:hypothetical protein
MNTIPITIANIFLKGLKMKSKNNKEQSNSRTFELRIEKEAHTSSQQINQNQPAPGIRNPLSSIQYQASSISFKVSSTQHLVPGIQHPVSSIHPLPPSASLSQALRFLLIFAAH